MGSSYLPVFVVLSRGARAWRVKCQSCLQTAIGDDVTPDFDVCSIDTGKARELTKASHCVTCTKLSSQFPLSNLALLVSAKHRSRALDGLVGRA